MVLFERILFSILRNNGKCNLLNKFDLKISFLKYYSVDRTRLLNSPKMKVSGCEFQSMFSDELHELLKIFKKHNYEIRIAGGAVRDVLLGMKPTDVDFATTATPQQMKDMFEKENIRMINMKGEKHGTITARINKQNFEVTTLRVDIKTDGRHADVMFTKDWILDANRRDLTINSMFLDEDGNLYDYFDGYNDLLNKRVVFVGDASKRIQEDYLRILRYFRFFGRISDDPNSHDPTTLKAIQDNIAGLKQVSGERIWTELSKILVGRHALSLMQKLSEVGAGKFIKIPRVLNLQELEKVLERSNGMKLLPMAYMAALMHSHEQLLQFHKRCKLSNADLNLAAFIIEYRNQDQEVKFFMKLHLLQRDPIVTRDQIINLFTYRGEHSKRNTFELWETPIFPIKGNILLDYGVPNGTSLGKVLLELKTYWIDCDFKVTQQDLIKMIPSVAEKLKIKLN